MLGVLLVVLSGQVTSGATTVDDAAHHAARICPVPEDAEPAAMAHTYAACLQALMHRAEQRLAATAMQKARARRWTRANAFHQRWLQAQCGLTSRNAGGGSAAEVDLAQTQCLARLYSERAFFAERLAAGDLQRVQRLLAAPESDCALKTEALKTFAARLPAPSRHAAWLNAREAARVISGADGLARWQCKALGWRGRCRSELEHYYLSLVVVPHASPTVAEAPDVHTRLAENLPAILP